METQDDARYTNTAFNVAQTARGARRAGSSKGQFQLPRKQATAPRAEVSGPAAVSGVDTIIALQAIDDPTARRRKAFTTGGRILDLLDRLKIGLLCGQVSVSDLDALKTTIAGQQSLESDPELSDILKQIDLRARVELAKLRGNAA